MMSILCHTKRLSLELFWAEQNEIETLPDGQNIAS